MEDNGRRLCHCGSQEAAIRGFRAWQLGDDKAGWLNPLCPHSPLTAQLGELKKKHEQEMSTMKTGHGEELTKASKARDELQSKLQVRGLPLPSRIFCYASALLSRARLSVSPLPRSHSLYPNNVCLLLSSLGRAFWLSFKQKLYWSAVFLLICCIAIISPFCDPSTILRQFARFPLSSRLPATKSATGRK